MTPPVYMPLEQTLYGVPFMAKKKTASAEHVVLSKATVAKLLATQPEPEGPDVITLTPFDMLELERSEARQAQAQTLLRVARLERQVLTLTRQLQDVETGRLLQSVGEASQQAIEAHRKLADAMAERYHFSWKTHSYQPETGEVRAADPES